MLHCIHTGRRLRCGRPPPMRKVFSPVSQFIGDGQSKGYRTLVAYLLTLFCQVADIHASPAMLIACGGVLCGLCQVTNGRTHNLPISRSRATINISYLLLSCAIPWSSPTVFDHNADKKDSIDNCDSCPASHTDSRHGHFPSLDVSAVDSTTTSCEQPNLLGGTSRDLPLELVGLRPAWAKRYIWLANRPWTPDDLGARWQPYSKNIDGANWRPFSVYCHLDVGTNQEVGLGYDNKARRKHRHVRRWPAYISRALPHTALLTA